MSFSQGINSGLGLGQAFQQGRSRREEEKLRGQLSDLQGQIDTSQPLSGQEAFQRMTLLNPDKARKIQQALRTDEQGVGALLEDALFTQQHLLSDPSGGSAVNFLNSRAQAGESQNRNMFQTRDLINTIQNNGAEAGLKSISGILNVYNQLQSSARDQQQTASQKEFASLTKDLDAQQKKEATLIKLGLSPRAVGSAIQTISDKGIEERIGNVKSTINQRAKFGELTANRRSKVIDKGFDRIQKIDTGLGNIDRAISAINQDAGVGYGAARKFLPSFRDSSVALDNIQGSMALDVIGSVTFGALSEGELDLAKEVALPTGLSKQGLIKHLTDRKAAQNKLRNYYNEQVQFLDQGGTVAGFLRKKEREADQAGVGQVQPEAQPQQAAQPQAQPQAGTFTSSALGRQISEQDIADTLQANPGLTREALLQQLGIQ